MAERNRFSPSARAGHLRFVAPGPAPDFRPRGAPRTPRAAYSIFHRNAPDNSGAAVTAPIASLPFLRIFFRLSVDIEIDFINAGLPPGAWLGVPCLRTQFDLAEFLHSEAPPPAYSLCRHRQAAVAASSKLIEQRVQPVCFPAQHMGTKQSGQAIVVCRYQPSPNS